jgi:PAS domain S-box-containing protein
MFVDTSNEQLKYQDIFEKAPTLITSIDQNGQIIDCNKRVYEILGYEKEEIIGKSMLNFIHPDYHSKVYEFLDENWFDGIFFKEEYKMIRKDGNEIFVSVNSSDLESNDKGILKKVWIIEDITDTKLIQEKLIENFNRAKVYLDILGHDINSINKEITLSSELLLLKPDLTEQNRRFIKTTLSQCREISGLISNLQKLSELLIYDFKFEYIDVFKILAESFKEVQQIYPDRSLVINQSISEAEVLVKSNDLLKDVFINILSNAIKFDYHNEIIIDIKHSQSEDGRYWRIEFQDNGPGTPNLLKEKIFRGFDINSKNGNGCGLGLVVVKEIVTRCGGRIWVEDRVKGNYRSGSNFVLLLPKGLAG